MLGLFRPILKPLIALVFLGTVASVIATGELPSMNLNSIGTGFVDAPRSAAAADDPSGFTAAALVRVVDGDTIVVNRGNGEETVRLIGIDTPESVHPDESRNTAEGDAASAHTKEVLADVDVVYLEKDVSETDKYGRLLRYVWLDVPGDPIAEAPEKMLNAMLVGDGNAVAKDYAPDTKYSELLHSQQQAVS